MIRAEALSKHFGTNKALSGVDLEVNPGEIFGLLGPNGAGKTTLVRILTGVLAPGEGRAEISGHDVSREPDTVKSLIGYSTQDASVYHDLTVRENLEFRARLYLDAKQAKVAVNETLSRTGIQEYADDLAGALSGGWRQRLAIGLAVVHAPEVLFLDEPTTGLDPLSRRAVWDLIHQEAGRGAAVLVTTHYMDEAERCHRLALLFAGRVIATGTSAELKAQVGERARFVVAHTTRSLESVRSIPGVLEAWPSGDGFRLILSPTARLEGVDAKPVAPNLEDAFIVLTREVSA